MPKLIRLYIRQAIYGFGLSAIFVAAILYTNVGNLWHLILGSPMGWVAVVMLFMFHGVVFGGVQFAIAVMRMEKSEDDANNGTRAPATTGIPAPLKAAVSKR